MFYGFSYEQAAVIRSEQGTDELEQTLVDRLRRRCDAVLVLGSDFSGAAIPHELACGLRGARDQGPSTRSGAPTDPS